MKKNRKAFTIVELVIVIAVVAVLATVLVPTFSDIIGKAQDSKAMQAAKNAYTEYMIDNAADGASTEYMIFETDGGFVALRSGAAVGVYKSREAALTAMLDDSETQTDESTGYTTIQTAAAGLYRVAGKVDWSGASVAFVGDSISDITVRGTYTTKYYYEYLDDVLDLTWTVDAICGRCISDKCNGSKVSSLYDIYQNIPANQDLIVIFMGTNDYGHAAQIGAEDSTDPNCFYGVLNTVLPYLVENHPNSQIVIMTPLHRDGFKIQSMTPGDYSDGAKNIYGHVLLDYVNILKETCSKYHIPVIDLYNLCTLDPTDPTYFYNKAKGQSDGLHPNAAGHEELAKIIAEELEKIPRK